MLSFNSVTLLLGQLLNGDTSLDGSSGMGSAQREYFYVGGEYHDVVVSSATF
jgi:hypothetical protein